MAYDETLAERVRDALSPVPDLAEIKMFGGLCFTVRGNMAVGIHKEDLIVRVAAADGEAALSKPHVRPMDITGRPMKGFLFVAPRGVRTSPMLRAWVDRGVAFASSLPPKKAKAKKSRAKKPVRRRG